MSQHLMPTYSRLPVTFIRGDGPCLWDQQERCYLDALSGISVCSLGHAHPAVTESLCDQVATLIHTSNLYGVELQQQLADKLCEISGLEKVFFGNSGAEANEAAIKIARRYGNRQKLKCPNIIVMENSFHGRTMATLTATGNVKVKEGFAPLVEGFIHVPYNDIAAVEKLAGGQNDICAVLVEPIQGEGGIRIPAAGYLQALRKLCDANNWLLMLDEIQSGMGRTGRWFAFQHEAIKPDVITLAKALGNGVPIGACLAQGVAAKMLQPGSHGSTFGGNPLASRAALTVIATIENDGLIDRCAALGQQMLDGFKKKLGNLAGVVDVRGKGLMLGIQLDRPCGDLVQQALNARLLINVTAGNVVRLLPPYIIDNQQADAIVEGVSELIVNFLQQKTAA
ncbi:MAG: aspartate aminotransferase family protein [Gammaproteobacteria bacterium]|nr:aspartate aminotransferase family protein [Gammaproteobacteria bacterium]